MRHLTHPRRDLLALGIRQPWAELILRGVKTIEVRTLPTNVRGTIYLYTGKRLAVNAAADVVIADHLLDVEMLPLNRLVGTVDIVDCRPSTLADARAACVPSDVLNGMQAWCLANPMRLDEPLKPRFRPYGIWFYPFKRRQVDRRRKT